MTAVVVMQSLGADAVGMNCSTGPEAMLEPIAKMAEYATIPLLAKPNAGMPELIDGQTVFNVEPEEFAEVGKKLVEEGAAIIGGCCGTTPEHIRALKEAVKGIPVKAPLQTKRRMLTSERKSVEITLDGRFMVIGERINPTGKKKLQAELKEGSLNLVRTMALEQEENGASILDINMGMNGIDEKEMMLRTIYEVTSTVDCPLCIVPAMWILLRPRSASIRDVHSSIRFHWKKKSLKNCFRLQRSTGQCLSCFHSRMRGCQKILLRNMALSARSWMRRCGSAWQKKISLWMDWLPQSEQIRMQR